MVFAILSSAVTSLAAFAFPIFASFKAINANDVSQMVPWLMFWSVQACLLFAEHWFYVFLQWVPLYREAKMIFTLWMVLPQTQGARQLYLRFIRPQLALHEHDLDHLLIALHDQIKRRGGIYLELLLVKISDMFFGSSSKAIASQTSARSTSPSSDPLNKEDAGYIAYLFSRFSTSAVDSARESTPSALKNLLNQFERQGTDIIPANLSSEERGRYVAQQKAKLQECLHILEAADRSYTLTETFLSRVSDSDGSRRRYGRESGFSSHGTQSPGSTGSDFEDLGSDEALAKQRSIGAAKARSGWFWGSTGV